MFKTFNLNFLIKVLKITVDTDDEILLLFSQSVVSKFNSDVHCIYCCGPESLRRNGAAFHDQQRSLKLSACVQHKNDRMISVCFQGEPFSLTVAHVYAPTTDAREDEVERFYEDLQDLLELTHTRKKMSFSSQGPGMQK